jgi:hypothetical protein
MFIGWLGFVLVTAQLFDTSLNATIMSKLSSRERKGLTSAGKVFPRRRSYGYDDSKGRRD